MPSLTQNGSLGIIVQWMRAINENGRDKITTKPNEGEKIHEILKRAHTFRFFSSPFRLIGRLCLCVQLQHLTASIC